VGVPQHAPDQGRLAVIDRATGEHLEADGALLPRLRRLAGTQRHAIVIEHQQCAIAHDGRAHVGKVERHHVELLAGDVAPHVLLGPIREREDARRLARAEAAVQQPPHLRPLPARVPAVAVAAKREHALLGPRGFLVAPRPAEGGVEGVRIERLPQTLRLHHVCVDGRRKVERVDAARHALLVDVHDQVEPELMRGAIAEGDHGAELPGRVDVQQRERRLARPERLARQMRQYR
jgi:hypothetical protein